MLPFYCFCFVLQKFYERKPNGLHGALQDVGIEFHGRQHSGKLGTHDDLLTSFRELDQHYCLIYWKIRKTNFIIIWDLRHCMVRYHYMFGELALVIVGRLLTMTSATLVKTLR